MNAFEVASKYIGQTEKPANAGFNDAEFEAKMKAVGFQPSFAWCALFTELVFKETYPHKLRDLDKLFSASAVQTFKNFEKASYPIGNVPREGHLVIWQTMKNGVPQATGHAGIVGKVTDNWIFESIEGNTSDSGSREGYIVAKRIRKHIKDVKDGLKVLGFVQVG